MSAALTLLDADEPIKPRLSFMQVTPEIAKRWLTRNPRNRVARPATVARYARDMAAGKWHLDGSPIRFDATGTLLDGQHRLAAIIESEATIITAVNQGGGRSGWCRCAQPPASSRDPTRSRPHRSAAWCGRRS